jgi:hypothetical protein
MKILGKVYMHITNLFNEIPNGLHNSLSPRPELVAGADNDLPVHVNSKFSRTVPFNLICLGNLVYLSHYNPV